jgi:hypothetical protein
MAGIIYYHQLSWKCRIKEGKYLPFITAIPNETSFERYKYGYYEMGKIDRNPGTPGS